MDEPRGEQHEHGQDNPPETASAESGQPLQHPRYLPPGFSGENPPPLKADSQLDQPDPLTSPHRAPEAPAKEPGEVMSAGIAYKPAGCWHRLGAFLIDWVLLVLFWRILLLLLNLPEPDYDLQWQLMGRALDELMLAGMPSQVTLDAIDAIDAPFRFSGYVKVAMCMAYFTIFHGMLGATLGKLVLGLRVFRRDGRPLGYGWAFLRYLGYWFCAKLAYTAWLIPLNREQRTLYDMVLQTNVFRKKKPAKQSSQAPTGYRGNR